MSTEQRHVALRPQDLGKPLTEHHTPFRCTRCGTDCWIDPARRLLALNGATALCYRCLYPGDPAFTTSTPRPPATTTDSTGRPTPDYTPGNNTNTPTSAYPPTHRPPR